MQKPNSPAVILRLIVEFHGWMVSPLWVLYSECALTKKKKKKYTHEAKQVKAREERIAWGNLVL